MAGNGAEGVDIGSIQTPSRMVQKLKSCGLSVVKVQHPAEPFAPFLERLKQAGPDIGIGISNVNERLKVLYGDEYRMWIDSHVGEGTSTGIELPEQASGTVVGVQSLAGQAQPAARSHI